LADGEPSVASRIVCILRPSLSKRRFDNAPREHGPYRWQA